MGTLLDHKQRPLRGVPFLNVDEQAPGESWFTKPRELLSKGRKLYPDQPFQILTHGGPKIALPRRYFQEVRDSQRAAFPLYFIREAPWNLPGFDGILISNKHAWLLREIISVKLMQSLVLITERLADEGILVTEDLFGTLARGKWHTVTLLPEVTKIIGHFTARTVLGKELDHNQKYIDISIKYGVTALPAALEFRSWPRIVWPIMQYFISLTMTARYQAQRVRQLIANDEMKIALCILLLRYDWKATPDVPKPLFNTCEDFPTFKSSLQVQITPREPEIDLASPKM